MNQSTTSGFLWITKLLTQNLPATFELSKKEAEQILELCKQHNVSSLAYKCLENSVCEDNVAKTFKHQLMHEYRIQCLFNMVRESEENRILDALEQQGIRPVLLKGAGISRTHYQQPELRERSDTDIFIDAADIDVTQEIFRNLGYDIGITTYRSHQFSATSSKNESMLMSFDVHWRISNNANFAQTIDYKEALHNSVLIDKEKAMRTLSSPYALLIACLHRLGNANHNSNMLKWIYDIHLLITSMSQKELQRFILLAKQKRLTEVCLDGMRQSHSMLNTDIHESVLSNLSKQNTPTERFQRFKSSQLALILNDITILPGWRAKSRLIKEYIFPNAEYLLHLYHKKNKSWLPILWLRHFFIGMYNRLTLK